MSLRLRFLEPVVGSVPVLRHTVAAETEFSQQVLRIGIAPFGSPTHIFRRAFRIFGRTFSAEIFLAKPVGGVVAAALRRPFQPIEALCGILYFRIIREEQLAQRILRRRMILLRRQFQIVLCLFCVRDQQPAITIENACQVLRVSISAVCQRFQLLCGFVAFLQRQGFIRRHCVPRICWVRNIAGGILLRILLCACVFERDLVLPHLFCHLKDRILDLPEFLLLGERRALPLFFRVEIVQPALQLPPAPVAFIHARQQFHLIDNGIDFLLEVFRQISVGLLSLDAAKLQRQLPNHLLRLRMLAGRVLHLLCKRQHSRACFPYQLVAGLTFVLVDVQQLLPKDLIGQDGFDLLNPVTVQVRLPRLFRPRHHVDVRVTALVVERRIPAEVLRRDTHCLRNVIPVRPQQRPPCVRVIEPKPLRVLASERNDVRPDVPGITVHLRHRRIQVDGIFISEQPVFAHPLRARSGCDILGVAVDLLHLAPVFLHRQREKLRGVEFRRMRRVIAVFQERFRIRKILRQFFDELRLPFRRRTVVRQNFYPFTRGDVAQIPARRFCTAALEIRTFDDQSGHSSNGSCVRSFCSSRSCPLVRFTSLTLFARCFRSTDSSRFTHSASMLSPMSSSTACLNSRDEIRCSKSCNLPSMAD